MTITNLYIDLANPKVLPMGRRRKEEENEERKEVGKKKLREIEFTERAKGLVIMMVMKGI